MIEIQLTQGKVAIVDDIDSDLNNFKWYCNGGYARRNIGKRPNRKQQHMHRVILERILGRTLIKGEEVDHINRNRLDNRRDNLRIATKAQNQHNRSAQTNNTSGFKGVSHFKKNNKWFAQIRINNKLKYLGSFDTPEQAYDAYCEAANELHGEFSNHG